MDRLVGAEALELKGWWHSYQWLILRRVSQISILGLFLLGPWMGIWILKGNLSSSLILDTVPMTDPYLLLQVLVTGHIPEMTAITGALIILGFYSLAGGRIYCSWVCPVNMITDSAAWLRRRLNIRPLWKISRRLRYWILALTLLVTALMGMLVWELVNPVSAVFRSLIFGVGMGWVVMLTLFIFELFIVANGWCGHLCPVGAFYSLVGIKRVVRMEADQRERCNDCADCYVVCPEPQVLKPALKGTSDKINDMACTQCGRCLDICGEDVFHYRLQLGLSAKPPSEATIKMGEVSQ